MARLQRLTVGLEAIKARREALEREESLRESVATAAAAKTAREEAGENGPESREARSARLDSLRAARARKRRVEEVEEAAEAVATTRRIRVTTDARGDEQLELFGGPAAQGSSTVVMMRWEKPYMEACVEALGVRVDDDVLEVGYGLGFSARAIRARTPRSHVVVECDDAVLARARQESSSWTLVASTWQRYLARPPSDRRFSAVFFDGAVPRRPFRPREASPRSRARPRVPR